MKGEKPTVSQPYPRVADLLSAEAVPVPQQLAEGNWIEPDLGPHAHAYTSEAFHRLEMEKMWGRVWQMACREDEIPDQGDYILYEIGDLSVIVVRGENGAVHAHHNVCLHRGRQLVECAGKAAAIRCPYHGFKWSLEGALEFVPSAWDFEHLDRSSFRLKGVRADTWGGFVFVCFDPEAPSLLTQLEDIPEIFARWPMEERCTTAHVAKELDCNWKIALEAFVETLHVTGTHPQIAGYVGDEHTQYDVWEGRRHYNRMIAPRGVSSPSQGPLTQQDILHASDRGSNAALPEGVSARREMANRKRAVLAKRYGRDYDWITDSEAIDTIQYHVFPNLVLWFGLGSPYSYRFRPLGNDPNRSIMEIYFFEPLPADGPPPPRCKTRFLDAAASWTEATEIGTLGIVADQDVGNLGAVQRGLRTGALDRLTLGHYSENRIRHYHRILHEYLDA